MEYVNMINGLRETPEFYNTLTTNCAASSFTLIRAFGGDIRYSWKILLSGYAASFMTWAGWIPACLSPS